MSRMVKMAKPTTGLPSGRDTTYAGLKVGVLSAGLPSGIGGAERFYEGLVGGLRGIGCEVDLIPLEAREPSFRQIARNYKTAKQMDLSEYDVVISNKAPTYAVIHPRHIVYLMHTVRVYDDLFERRFPTADNKTYRERFSINKLDFEGLSGARAIFSQSHEVTRRLYRWCGLAAQTLHPPLAFNEFKNSPAGDYFFLPGRLHPLKRVDLIIGAVKRSRQPMRFLIAGTGECEGELKRLAAGDTRIEFLGQVDDEKLVSLYASALGVPFVPLKEDYGYVTIEAFASAKPVITCSDSGEPVHFVRQYQTGLVAEPTAESICQSLEWLVQNRERAADMGKNGFELTKSFSWTSVAEVLVSAALGEEPAPSSSRKVAVLDMQPITPPVGGGRLRLSGLYHNLESDLSCRYVGSYDWPGEPYRSTELSESLVEIVVPLSNAHHRGRQGARGNWQGAKE